MVTRVESAPAVCKAESEGWLAIEHPHTLIASLFDLAAVPKLTMEHAVLMSFGVSSVCQQRKK